MSKTIKYGIVGFSRNQFDQETARQILEKLFRQIQEKHKEKEIEIVSGYTNTGVPKIAYELADAFGFTTVGFSAEQALAVKSGVYPVAKVMLFGKKFGDESEAFVQYIDALIRVGGGKQSRREVTLFKELNQEKSLENFLKEFEIDWYGD